ncbi:MAG: imidazole glycerol phosphate synthase subunit HisH [Terrimesophilobacter sp.]
MMIGIVDSGIGTTASVANMLHHISVPARVSAHPTDLDGFSHLILPGVGHFTEGARRLSEGGWRDPVRDFAQSGRPVLGICLGMQLLGEGSDEGEGEGLGLLPFRLEKLRPGSGMSVPHMGWNTVEALGADLPLLETSELARYYFVHSYGVPADSVVARGTTTYGVPFASVVGHKNVLGVQFHPEKSHRFGMTLLRNFSQVDAWLSLD